MTARASIRGASRHAVWQVRAIGFAALALGIAAALAASYFVMSPTEDPVPRHADVALVLGPPTPLRVSEAYRLLDRGTVDAVLISLASDSVNVPYWKRLCARPDTTCRVPKPYTTQGEARALVNLASERDWDSAVVITQTAHVARARLLVERCFWGTVSMRESGEPPSGGGWIYQIPYQTAATAKAVLFDRAC